MAAAVYDTASAPARGGFAVTPSDATDFAVPARSLWVGGAGNIVVKCIDNSVITLVGVTAGTLIPVRAKRVNSTNTTATNIVGLI